jgi:hypothetical protein
MQEPSHFDIAIDDDLPKNQRKRNCDSMFDGIVDDKMEKKAEL